MSNAIATVGDAGTGDLRPALTPLLARDVQQQPQDVVATARARPGRPKLSRDQKAAIIVRLMSGDATALPLSGLEDHILAQLVRATAGLHFVDEATVLAVIDEFLTEFDSLALYFKPGLDAASQAFDSYLGDGVNRLLAGPEDTAAPIDPWDKIKVLEATALAPLLADETAEVCAITLAKLPAGQSAELLELLGSEKARGVTLAATRAGAVSFGTVHSIGVALADAAAKTGDSGPLEGDPADRVSQILNFASGEIREDLLESLEAADADMAARIRRSMFTFADIPDRVEVKDVPKLVRAVENEVLVAALAGGASGQKDAVDFILTNLSKRLSEQLTEEIQEIGDVKPKDADKAMSALIQGIRGLEASGEIVLILPDE